MIRRDTRGGSITISGDPIGPGACTLCGGAKTAEGQPPLQVDVNGTATLFVCGDCMATALAIAFGRAHVDQGGSLEDLDPGPPA